MTGLPRGEPIWIECEGSGAQGHPFLGAMRICPMCGVVTQVEVGKIPPHNRDDILSRIDRGDFG